MTQEDKGRLDWDQPIEAVHEATGEVYPASWSQMHGYKRVEFNGNALVFDDQADGSRFGWRIRNVAKPVLEPRTAPSGGEVGPEVDKGRLKALEAFWEFVVDTQPYDDALDVILAKARALLPEAADADADLFAAREACAAFAETIPDHGLAQEYRNGDMDDQFEVKASLFAVRRALEKEAGR